MSHINGVEYYRRKRRLTKLDLAKKAGVSQSCIEDYESRQALDRCGMEKILRLADALDVTVDQLLEDHDRKELTLLDRSFRDSGMHNPKNPLAIYRKVHNLTLDELSERLGGLTRWGTSKICRVENPPVWHIRALAQWEDMSVEEFLDTYCYEEEGDACEVL